MKLIRFSLCAPLQSWDDHSRWDRRDTSSMPTKSAVIGLLGCCMGLPRRDARLSLISNRLHMAVRADRPSSVMTDFHTLQGTNGVMYKADGTKRSGGHAAFQMGALSGKEKLRPDDSDSSSVEEAVFDEGVSAAQIEVVPGETLSPQDGVIERRDEVVRADLNAYGMRSVRISHGRKAGDA